MKVKDFNYDLPSGLIASEPLKQRDSARLMVIQRSSGEISGTVFRDIGRYIYPGDCVVINDTRVIPARLYGRRKTGGKVEIFLIEPFENPPTALVRSSGNIRCGEVIGLEGGGEAKILQKAEVGRYVSFSATLEKILKSGHVPLPPYIGRDDLPRDRQDYQTVYASRDGATASPTAGLHFTRKLLNELTDKGVKIARVTLHTSYGTFSPVKAEKIEDHKMHGERYNLSDDAADVINRSRSSGGKIVAVGTTSARVIETCASGEGMVRPSSGISNLFIYPGYRFKMVDAMVTNFHLPQSTLLMMVSALAGKDLIDKAYRKAIREKYRFFSYGDATLIL